MADNNPQSEIKSSELATKNFIKLGQQVQGK